MHLLKYDHDTEKDSASFFKQNKIFNELIVERPDETLKLSKKHNYVDLTYHYKCKDIRKKRF